MKKIFAIGLAALAVFATSCVKDKVYDGVSIGDITNTIAYTASDKVTVTAKITALVPIKEVKLVYSVGSEAAKTADMTGSETYTGIIPEQPLKTEVSFYIEASTATATTKSSVVKYTVGAVPIDYSGLRLNELNGNDKFIEIYNAGADIPSLEGVYIEKDGTNVWTGDKRPLKNGEFLLLYSEDVVAEGEAHEGYDPALVFHSGLSAKKAVRVQLFTPAAVSLSDFNLVTFVTKAPASYSRNDNGKWYFAEATPGTVNVNGDEEVPGLEGGDPVTPGSVILNELNGNDKFIELANPGDLDFDISGYTIEKDGDVNWTAVEGITVPAKGYLLLYSEDVVVEGEAQYGYDPDLVFHSGLSAKKAVKIELKDKDGASVECFNLVTCAGPAPASYSKNANGKWYHADATPGETNVEGTDEVTGLE